MIEIPQLLDSKLPALLFSGGKESLLLLDTVRHLRGDVIVIHFYDRIHPEVEEVFKGWELEFLSWRPASQYLIPFDSDIALVSEYSFGSARLPVLRDVVDGEDCELEKLRSDRTEWFDNPFTEIFWGMKKCDELHPVMPAYFEREVQLGDSKLIAPLYDWSDEDVIEAVKQLSFPPVTNDGIRMCEKCKEGLASWDREASLNYFSSRFGYQKAA